MTYLPLAQIGKDQCVFRQLHESEIDCRARPPPRRRLKAGVPDAFKKLRFHDLRGTHKTLLLDRGVPVHVVAARCGHDPAVLLRNYAKRTAKADTNAASVIGKSRKECAWHLKTNFGTQMCPTLCLVMHCTKCLILLQRKGGRVVLGTGLERERTLFRLISMRNYGILDVWAAFSCNSILLGPPKPSMSDFILASRKGPTEVLI
jgi:hypothetical protein